MMFRYNSQSYYLKHPLQLFEQLTNKYINEKLDRLIKELLSQGWHIEILSRPINELDVENFAFLGELKNEETKEALIEETLFYKNELKKK